MRDSFIFYKSFYDSIHRIQNKELKADIFEAICELALNCKDIELTDDVGLMIMDLIKPQILANTKKYEDGKKGGRPKKKTSGYEKEKTSGYENKKPNVNVNDNVNVNVNDNEYIYFQNQDLENIFVEFLQIRKKLKAINSERAIKMLINKLSKYDDKTKYAMIEQSIVHSWKDIYELKEAKQADVPAWMNEERKEKELTDEQKRILAKIRGND